MRTHSDIGLLTTSLVQDVNKMLQFPLFYCVAIILALPLSAFSFSGGAIYKYRTILIYSQSITI